MKKNINNYKNWEVSQEMDVYTSTVDEERKEKGEKISFILNHLEVLTQKQKEVVILTLLEGKSRKEVCSLMEISSGRYQDLYHYAVVRLHRCYNEYKNSLNLD